MAQSSVMLARRLLRLTGSSLPGAKYSATNSSSEVSIRFACIIIVVYMHSQKRTVTLIKGDGIGPEISQAVMDIFQAAQVGL